MKIKSLLTMALAAVAIVFGVSACGSDDDDEPEVAVATKVAGSYIGNEVIMVNNDESSNETKTYVITKVTDTSIDLTVPEVGMGGMMTIPSFSVKNIPLVKSDDNTMGRLISYSGTVVGANGAEKAYTIGDMTVLFNDKTVVVKFSLKYGNMPFAMLTTFTGKRQ